jgi:CII-binding regulator of phage lambda lysogenization HflD
MVTLRLAIQTVTLLILLSAIGAALAPQPDHDTVVSNTQKLIDLQRQVQEHHDGQAKQLLPERIAVLEAGLAEVNYKLDKLLYLVLAIVVAIVAEITSRIWKTRM